MSASKWLNVSLKTTKCLALLLPPRPLNALPQCNANACKACSSLTRTSSAKWHSSRGTTSPRWLAWYKPTCQGTLYKASPCPVWPCNQSEALTSSVPVLQLFASSILDEIVVDGDLDAATRSFIAAVAAKLLPLLQSNSLYSFLCAVLRHANDAHDAEDNAKRLYLLGEFLLLELTKTETVLDRTVRSLIRVVHLEGAAVVVELATLLKVHVSKGLSSHVVSFLQAILVDVADDDMALECVWYNLFKLYVADGVYEMRRYFVLQLCDAGRVDIVCDMSWGAFEAQVEELLLWQAANTHAHLSRVKSSQSASALYRLLYTDSLQSLEPFAPSIIQVQRDALLAASNAGLASDAGDCALTVFLASDVHKQLLLVRGKLASPEHRLALGSPAVVSLLPTHLAPGVNVNCMHHGSTPLHKAASEGRVDVVCLLLEKGADVNASKADGQRPLHQAAFYGQVNVARLLYEKGANVNASNATGYTPLHYAAERNKSEMVQLLLDRGAKIDAKNKLFVALREKRIPDAVRILLNNFLHVNLRDSSETPLLHLVVATQDLSLLRFLLLKPDLQIDAKDSTGRTALTVAITADNAELVRALYLAGAVVDLVDKSLCASTPTLVAALRQAASINDDSTVDELLRLGVSCSLANEKGETAWHMAAAKGHMSIITMLLQQETKDENGIDVTNHAGESPLFVAAAAGHADVVEALVLGNASMHCVSNTDSTLLHAAILGGKTSILDQLFLFCGDAKDACDEMGQTPLHIAAAKNLVIAVKYLVKAKANVFATTITGKTPLMLATDRRVIAILQQAENKGKLKKPRLSDAELDQLVDRICDSEAMLSKLIQRVCNRLDIGHEALEVSVDRPEGTRGANGHVQAVFVNDASQVLLADDSHSNAANEAADSSLHLAVQTNDHKTLMSLLRSPGIKVDVRNAAGVTPVILAIQMGHRRLATMLQNAAHRAIPSVPASDIELDQSSPLYGTVYPGTLNGRVVAIKTCNSPYVQLLLAVSDITTSSPKLILEYMDAGDLRSYLDAKRLGEPTKVNVSPLQVAWVIANALADLHHNGVFHHDLESYNVLLSSTNYIKVANLGCGLESDTTTGKSTPYWIAPEVLASTSNYSCAADIYSFGVILTELDTLQVPFHDVKGLGYWGIIDGVRLGNLRPTVSANCPQWLRDLANACLSFDPTQRPSALIIVQALQELLWHIEEALVTPIKREQTGKLAELSTGSPTTFKSDDGPETLIKPATSDVASDANTASAAVTPTTFMTPAKSATTSSAKSISTQIVCRLCHASNWLLQTHCQGCAEELAPVAFKLKMLLKRLIVAKKNGFEIDDDLFCDYCNTHQPIKATTCDNCDDALPDDHEKLRILMLRIEKVTKSKA
ncbi:TKL protein kinase [Saprolegnia parasitica CBS 223.65]|uniref:TKL protein kinase n=1 Tax=Saprolegnia parasitica (strain CBS 223.65) TaxID=695850 RepID=A0A067BK18_SAPPC|nr:TKL protein kinase [Saprolegnia parasitica CBS 223.65]KDO18794.1 TKL protein kinase [Saprolegnia parasitica CBS 223.65]|eukprot:XP_012210493.1 TKL protein kinase [Saprolegnia parasitica CBS 223.65]